MLRKVLPLAALVLACGATAATAQATTISLGAPSLSGRVAITEPVTVSCSPFDPSLTLFGESVNVSVEQASGRSIARGSGSAFGFVPALLFACDGSQNTVPVTILADTAGPPFHGGTVVVSASASASAGTPCFPGSNNCFFNISGQSASTGPTTLHLH
jgi:hypothetical protein